MKSKCEGNGGEKKNCSKNHKNKIIFKFICRDIVCVYQFRSTNKPIRPANDLFGRMYKPILKIASNL